MQLLIPYLCTGFLLFTFGIFITITKKNAIHFLIGIELLLLASLLNFVVFARFVEGGVRGQSIAILVIILIVSETLIALAVFINMYRHKKNISITEMDTLKG